MMFKDPIKVVVDPEPITAGSLIMLNAGCSTLDSISILTVSGGTVSFTYS